ncbi:YaaR family protein [Planococcus lenghuensis]|uniref:YaaR family protein n=1 Tax=Planococcus lenghuensis TaxID=2213202 RepID=UPI001E325FAF|nr:DUF327 family protein [Planococcus lenghuensis]
MGALRIEGQQNFQNERIHRGTAGSKPADLFASAMKESQAKLQFESLTQLMTQVDARGEKLAKQRTLENLMAYKQVLKQFIGESVNYGLQLSEKQSFGYNGGMRKHQVIETVDQKLIELQDEVLASESDGVETLRLVGEIKGLLVNLYM